MKPIKDTIIYTAELPSLSALEQHLSQHPFKEPSSFEFCASGFETVLDDRFVLPFPGGYAFAFRYDEKIIPASVTTELANKKIAEIEAQEDRRLPKKERNRIRDEIVSGLLPKALCNTNRVTCFYRTDSNRLIVPTTSKKLAKHVTSKLLKCVGSIKFTTIYIDGINVSLTAKLAAFLDGDDHAFAGLDVGGQCKIKGDESGSAAFKKDTIEESKDGITEALGAGGKVTELSLQTDAVAFKINTDFVLKSIHFIAEPEEHDFEHEIEFFQHEAAVQTLMIDELVNELCDVFGYQAPEQQ